MNDTLEGGYNLQEKIEKVKENMGYLYLCHKSNHVQRTTPMPTTESLVRQWEIINGRLQP